MIWEGKEMAVFSHYYLEVYHSLLYRFFWHAVHQNAHSFQYLYLHWVYQCHRHNHTSQGITLDDLKAIMNTNKLK